MLHGWRRPARVRATSTPFNTSAGPLLPEACLLGCHVVATSQPAEACPAGVDLGLWALAWLEVAVHAAARAEPSAVRAAKRQDRQLSEEGVDDHGLEAEMVFFDGVGALFLAAVTPEQLAHFHLDPAVDARQAPTALRLPRGTNNSRDGYPPVKGLQHHVCDGLRVCCHPAVPVSSHDLTETAPAHFVAPLTMDIAQ